MNNSSRWQIHEIKEIHYYLVDADDCADLVDILAEATENDHVFIHINSNGGDANKAVQVMNAINNCQGNVMTIIEGVAAGTASMIFLQGHQMSATPYSYMRVVKLGYESSFVEQRNNELAAEVYDDFLSQSEINSLANGVEVYLSSEEILARLQQKHGNDTTVH